MPSTYHISINRQLEESILSTPVNGSVRLNIISILMIRDSEAFDEITKWCCKYGEKKMIEYLPLKHVFCIVGLMDGE